MTREEAIRLLDPKTTAATLAEIEYYCGFSGHAACIAAIEDACILAVEALEAKEKCDKLLDMCWDKILGDYPRWIPRTDMMPENYKPVLVQWQMKNRFDNTIEVFLHTGFINEYGEWLHADGLGVFNGEVIAWMPLPEPYKAGDEDGTES